MKKFNIKLREIDRIDLSFYDGIKMYIPIYGRIEALLGNKKYIIDEGEIFILNPFELAVFFPDFKNINNVIFEIEIPCSYIMEEHLDNIYFFNYINKKYIDTLLLDNISEIYDSFGINDTLSLASLSTFINKIRSNKYMVGGRKDSSGYNNLKLFYDRYVEDKSFADKTLAEISKEINISSSYFSNLFKDNTGVSLGTFKQKIKLKTASDLLLDTDYNLENISYKIGYQSTKSLYDIFLKHMGILPSEYRIKFKNIEGLTKEQLESKYIYSEFKNRSSSITYASLYENYPTYNLYEIDSSRNKSELFDWRGISIYSLYKLGHNYYDNIKTLNEDMGISFLVIDISIDSERPDLFYVNNLKEYLNLKDVVELLELLFRLDIRVGFSLGIYEKEIYDYTSKDYEKIESFLEQLLKIATRNVLIDYEWIINLNTIYSQDIVLRHYSKLENILVKVIGETAIISSFIGTSSYDELKELSDLIDKTEIFDRIKTIYFNYIYDNDIVIEYLNYDKYMNYDHRKFFTDFFADLDALTDKAEFLLCDIKIMYYSEHFKNLPNKVYQYSDLKMCFLDAENILNVRTDKLVYFEFFNTYNNLSKKTHLIREEKFKTCNYFNLMLLKQLEGRLLLNKPGAISTVNNLDYHVYLYNNLFLDNIFSSRKEYENLELYKRRVKLRLKGLKGLYKKSVWTIDLFNGNVLKLLDDLQTDYMLTNNEVDYIDRVNYPKKTVEIIEIKDDIYEDEVDMTPYSIKLVSYFKL